MLANEMVKHLTKYEQPVHTHVFLAMQLTYKFFIVDDQYC